jgi:hypothetical protein
MLAVDPAVAGGAPGARHRGGGAGAGRSDLDWQPVPTVPLWGFSLVL